MRPLFFLLCLTLAACQEDVTDAHVENRTTDLVVVKAWYRSTLFVDPIAPGASSESLRVGAGTEPLYALVARATDADAPSAGPLLVARSREPVSTSPGAHEALVVSSETMLVGCGPDGLSPEERDFVATRIFPRDDVAACDR